MRSPQILILLPVWAARELACAMVPWGLEHHLQTHQQLHSIHKNPSTKLIVREREQLDPRQESALLKLLPFHCHHPTMADRHQMVKEISHLLVLERVMRVQWRLKAGAVYQIWHIISCTDVWSWTQPNGSQLSRLCHIPFSPALHSVPHTDEAIMTFMIVLFQYEHHYLYYYWHLSYVPSLLCKQRNVVSYQIYSTLWF